MVPVGSASPHPVHVPETVRLVVEIAVEEAYVAVSRLAVLSKVRADESVNAPAVVRNGMRVEVSAETVKLVVLAVPK